jgi:hypothetical protein
MILDSATIQTMLKQDGMLVVTCFVKLVFQLSLFIHKQTHNPSIWTIRRWKCTDCQSGIGGGDKLVIRTPISNPSKDPIFIFMLLYRWSQDEQKPLVPKSFVTWRLIWGVETSDSIFGASGSALKLWRVARLLNRTEFSWPQESPIWFRVSFPLGTQLSNLAGNW